jgi:hypothetical protein
MPTATSWSSQITSLQSQLTSLASSAAQDKAVSVVEAAIEAGKIVPPFAIT